MEGVSRKIVVIGNPKKVFNILWQMALTNPVPTSLNGNLNVSLLANSLVGGSSVINIVGCWIPNISIRGVIMKNNAHKLRFSVRFDNGLNMIPLPSTIYML